jgi:glycosyltransferase involved in cell wall biosynthesis
MDVLETPLNDLVCLSHLRWDFVFQRPQHLMTRWAKSARVFYVEEPIFDAEQPHMHVSTRAPQLYVCVPHLPANTQPERARVLQRQLIEQLMAEKSLNDYVLWYYTPMALPFTTGLNPAAVVYDCMDELSAFRGAPPELVLLERQLLEKADLLTTGGHSLYRAKQRLHPNVHPFPSSVDTLHFAEARVPQAEPHDQREIPHVRLGFFGVIDERFDIDLVAGVAQLRPDWHLVMLGPVVKIDPDTLPRAHNLHYLGQKSYQELPRYIAGWDVAMLPFAKNESTRYISPTKTPEYLAAGRPVVSTSIADVIEPYGKRKLVQIADTPAEFVAAAERCLSEDPALRRAQADAFLAGNSWDATFANMAALVNHAVARRARISDEHAVLRGTPRRTATRSAVS